VTAYGTAPTGNVYGVNAAVTNSVTVAQATAASLNATVVGNVNTTIGNAAYHKVTDGTNTSAVKAASTAAVATDPALVVAMSPNNVPVATAQALLNDSVSTALQIVALSGSTKIYVTSFSIVASVAENVKFVTGTGSNCATGQTDMTSNMAFSANGGIARGGGMGPVLVVPAGQALCVLASTTGPTAVDVSYAQF
jgi:hypothetical protein